jgi:hypothetical protein
MHIQAGKIFNMNDHQQIPVKRNKQAAFNRMVCDGIGES